MNNVYHDAVQHLRFSESLYGDVTSRIRRPKTKLRTLRYIAITALMVFVMGTTAFAASPEFREWTFANLRLGVSQPDFPNAEVMNFTISQEMEGVTVHYMELDGADYHFVHGMLYNERKGGFMAITDDYCLEPVITTKFHGELHKNGRIYHDDLDYLVTERGIIARRKPILCEDENDEVFLVLSDGKSNQWPAYVNLESGIVRDALPDWTEDDFEGRIDYAYQYKGGILISTAVDVGTAANGNTASYNKLYWVMDGTGEAKIIELPEDEYSWYVENGEFYYRNNEGCLYRMNDSFEFDQICDYQTGDELTNGLLAAATGDKKLVIVDAYNGNRYFVDDYSVDPGRYLAGSNSRFGCELDETMGVNATRYGDDGTIAIVRTEYIPCEQRVALKELGILDTDSGAVRMIEIENGYDGYRNGWLDENRYAVIYKTEFENYLCIYEFE